MLMGLAVFSLLAFSSARPQYGRIEQNITRSGVDVIIALDVSPSMMAEDVKPNRLAKAKESLKGLIRRLKGNRVGIIAFAGDAFLNCPMTLDLSLANLVLEALDANSIGVAGTDIGKAIHVAVGAFERGGVGTPALVLLTDGEDNEGQGLKAAQAAAEKNVRIFTIGIGTEIGAPVPDKLRGYKETVQGTKVTSKMDATSLKAIAEATGGAAFLAGSNPVGAVDEVARQLNELQKTKLESTKLVIYQDRYAWFVAPALILLAWLLISRPEQSGDLNPLRAVASRAAESQASPR